MKESNKIIALASLGGMLELYDFAIYGTFASYFAHQFFPSTDHFTLILQTYSIFLLGFVLRPIGGILFSHIGDEKGRKKVLVYTILIMGLSSIMIAVIPTYNTIGIFSSVLLVVARCIQGLALGGELPTTYVYIKESLVKNRVLGFGVIMASILSGFLFANFMNYLLIKVFSQELLESIVWRVPFLFGGILCFISYKIRKTLHETTEFKEITNKPKIPFIYVFKHFFPYLIFGVIISAAQQAYAVIGIIFMPTYLHEFLKIDMNIISSLIPYGVFMTIVVVIISSIIARKMTNCKQLLLRANLVNLIIIPLGFYLIGYTNYLYSGYTLLMIGHGITSPLVPLYLTELFPKKIRLTGVALSYNISVISLAGTAPLIITELIKRFNLGASALAGYMMVIMIISSLILLFIREKRYD